MDDYKYDVFISYSSQDKKWVKWLKDNLVNSGIKVSLDAETFELGKPALDNMVEAVEKSRKTILVLTPNWLSSSYANFERYIAHALDPAGKTGRILPILLLTCDLPLGLKHITLLDFTQNIYDPRSLEKLIETLKEDDPIAKTQPPISILVLTSETNDQSFVNHHGIKPAIDSFCRKNTYLKFTYSFDKLNIKNIEAKIDEHTFTICDITEAKPEIFWSLGAKFAKGANLIILTRSDEVEISDHQIKYIFSQRGVERLCESLTQKMKKTYPEFRKISVSLIGDRQIQKDWSKMETCLKSVGNHSILKMLVSNEIGRVSERLSGLSEGRFDLRNIKPNEEIINYFSRYVSQLQGNKCYYWTISNFKFWTEITLNGQDFKYLDMCMRAAKSGAQIKRLLLINNEEFAGNVSSNKVFKEILSKHYKANQEQGVNFLVRVKFSNNYKEDINSLGNFAVWSKGTEKLFFEPQYTLSGVMRTTEFKFYDNADSDSPMFETNHRTVTEAIGRFNMAWGSSTDLTTSHFEDT